ncbi:MAG TPA: histidine kinase dimerization/phospho-acceptor domain-containing protein [Terriglobales bacterium]|nr:histidine kinase dimerization/phospho-acceptor domain-containing protein [Terriglobales bacterium]
MPQRNEDLFLNLAHVVNNPLTAIRNALYLAGRLSDDPELLAYLELANGEVSRISASLTAIWSDSKRRAAMKAAA